MSAAPSDGSKATTSGAAATVQVELPDPHLSAAADLQESEVTRVRTLRGAWRWVLMVATAATILLCINQQFSLRFFIDYTQLNTEYFYLLIALMLPFTFLIFPGSDKAPLDRIPWYDLLLFAATFAAAIWLMLNIRKAAALGWEFEGAPTNVIAAGLVMWFVLMEALR
ncbi:MAG TPA: TRAP transporter permease, partial [Bradyrhizobium sp.]|nr:TRAP transporter permease [Bradyrhizobium sp.]